MARAGAPAPWTEAEGQGWSTLGKSLQEVMRMGPASSQQCNSGCNIGGSGWIQRKSCFPTFPSLSNYLNMVPTSIAHPMLILFFLKERVSVILLVMKLGWCWVMPQAGPTYISQGKWSWEGSRDRHLSPAPQRHCPLMLMVTRKSFWFFYFFFKCQLPKEVI